MLTLLHGHGELLTDTVTHTLTLKVVAHSFSATIAVALGVVTFALFMYILLFPIIQGEKPDVPFTSAFRAALISHLHLS